MTFLQILLLVVFVANFKNIIRFLKHAYKILLAFLCAAVLLLYFKYKEDQKQHIDKQWQDAIAQYEKLVSESK